MIPGGSLPSDRPGLSKDLRSGRYPPPQDISSLSVKKFISSLSSHIVLTVSGFFSFRFKINQTFAWLGVGERQFKNRKNKNKDIAILLSKSGAIRVATYQAE